MIKSVKNLARRILKPQLHRQDIKVPYKIFGSDYGEWPLVTSKMNSQSVIFSFGVGKDISFDEAVIDSYGCVVHGFDPTPRSIAWVDSRKLPEKFHFHPVGIGGGDGDVNFYAPDNSEYVSYSIFPSSRQRKNPVIKAKILRLETLVRKLKLPNPDVVKMDIEGFEYEVIDDIVAGSIHPTQLLIEFHHGLYGFEKTHTYEAVEQLKNAGYRLFYVSPTGKEYGFVSHG